LSYIGKTPTAVPLTSSDITDGIVSNSKLAQDIISAETELATAPADTDELLISDAGVLKRIDASLIGGGGITQADQWRITADVTSDTNPISSNLERVDGTAFNYIGTGMSVSSGTWTFPSTGIYHVAFTVRGYMSTSDTASGFIEATTDNSSYNKVAEATWGEGGSSRSNTATCETFVDVTDTANVKVRFGTGSMASGTVLESDTNYNRTCFTFIRLGDT